MHIIMQVFRQSFGGGKPMVLLQQKDAEQSHWQWVLETNGNGRAGGLKLKQQESWYEEIFCFSCRRRCYCYQNQLDNARISSIRFCFLYQIIQKKTSTKISQYTFIYTHHMNIRMHKQTNVPKQTKSDYSMYI